MSYYVEIRSTVQRNQAPKLVPIQDVDKYHGFRSVVAYGEEVASLIREQGGSQSLRGQPVYADTLFMDFDGHVPTEFLEWLETTDLAYERLDSGNRSVHIHIPIVPIEAPWVTDAMREWTKKHAPTADTSFLHPAGQYRLEGTFHYKTSKQKTLVSARMGEPLQLEQPQHSEPIMPQVEGRNPAEFYSMLMTAKSEGNRAPFVWLLATTAAETGIGQAEALEHIRSWNSKRASPPRDDATICSQVTSAYIRYARRFT